MHPHEVFPTDGELRSARNERLGSLPQKSSARILGSEELFWFNS